MWQLICSQSSESQTVIKPSLSVIRQLKFIYSEKAAKFDKISMLVLMLLKVSKFQNEFMKPSFLPK